MGESMPIAVIVSYNAKIVKKEVGVLRFLRYW